MKPSIPLKDLVVVSMPNPTEIDAPVKPWNGMEQHFLAEDCNRFTFVLTKKEAAQLPAVIATQAKEDKQNHPHKRYPVKMEEGRAAYASLLKLALGMSDVVDSKPGEQKYVIPQWEGFSKKNPGRVNDFEGIVDDIRRDVHLINTHSKLAQLPKPTMAFATRHLLGLSGDHAAGTQKKNVLVVASSEAEAHDILRTLGQSAAVNSITVAGPDASHGNTAYDDFKQQVKEGRLTVKAPLELVPLDKALGHISRFDDAVICMRAGEYPKADAAIRDAWKTRDRKDGQIVHYGAISQTVAPLEPWIQSGLNNFVSPGRVAAECVRQITENENVLAEANGMVNDRAITRHMLNMTRNDNGHDGHSRG